MTQKQKKITMIKGTSIMQEEFRPGAAGGGKRKVEIHRNENDRYC